MKKSAEIITVVKSLLPNKENGYFGLITLVRQGYKNSRRTAIGW